MTRERTANVLASLAWAAVAIFAATLFAVGFFLRVTIVKPEVVHFEPGFHIGIAAAFIGMLALTVFMWRVCQRLSRMHLTALPAVVMAVVAALLLVGLRVRQDADFQVVSLAAQRFSRGDYFPLQTDYFQSFQYQLNTVFTLEPIAYIMHLMGVQEYFDDVMPVLNVLMGLGILLVLADMARRVMPDGERADAAVWAIGATYFPMWIYAVFVYGTMPMLLFGSLAIRGYVLYTRSGKLIDGLTIAIFGAAAYIAKLNAAILLAALVICAVLHGIAKRDWKPLLFVLAAVVIATQAPRFIRWQYAIRGNIRYRDRMGMLPRLTMGMQDGDIAAGWYNAYVFQFIGTDERSLNRDAIALADLKTRLGEFAADPAMMVSFFVEKFLSQWLEGAHGTMVYGETTEQIGVLAGIAPQIFTSTSPIRVTVEVILAGVERVLLLFAAVASAWHVRRERDAGLLVLPVVVIGGILYHMIFEAKSQYTFVYMIYMLPLAAQGLCLAGAWIKKKRAAK